MVAAEIAPREASWRRFLLELDWWVRRTGDAAVPQAAVSTARGEPYPLGRRVKAYRVAYKRGTLTADRVEAVEARPGWTWDGFGGRASRRWAQNLDAVRTHFRERGSLDGLDAADAAAARWLREQRDAELTGEQRAELASIPGALRSRRGRLDEYLDALTRWLDGDPQRTAAAIRFTTVARVAGNDYPLGRRTAYWRSRYSADLLTGSQSAALAAVPGWRWEAPSSTARPEARSGAPEGV